MELNLQSVRFEPKPAFHICFIISAGLTAAPQTEQTSEHFSRSKKMLLRRLTLISVMPGNCSAGSVPLLPAAARIPRVKPAGLSSYDTGS